MGIETLDIENNNESLMIVSGIEKDGTPQYEELKKTLPAAYPHISDELFRIIYSDLNNLPESKEILKFQVGEILNIAISSSEKTLYQIIDTRNGHYLLAKLNNGKIVPGKIELDVILSTEPRNEPNPFIIICSAEELDKWLRG